MDSGFDNRSCVRTMPAWVIESGAAGRLKLPPETNCHSNTENCEEPRNGGSEDQQLYPTDLK